MVGWLCAGAACMPPHHEYRECNERCREDAAESQPSVREHWAGRVEVRSPNALRTDVDPTKRCWKEQHTSRLAYATDDPQHEDRTQAIGKW